MARISGVELNDNWKVDFALTRIKGLGWTLAEKILNELKIDKSKRVSKLSPEELSKISSKLEEFALEGELARQVKTNITRLQTIATFRGLRHQRSLPVRGQRTRRNARTKRGKRKTVGAFKKEVLSKITAGKQEQEKK
jgi:small subunit ribosomal protein S13